MKLDSKVIERMAKDKQAVIEQLKKIPIIQIACERAGVGRSTYYRWCSEDEEFERASGDALDAGKAMINDMAESQLISSIKERNLPAIRFWLSHNHASYGQKVELSGAIKVANDVLTEDQEKLMKQALVNAGLVLESDTYET